LQLAKLDYLKSDAIDKSPAFWAHLVLTGDGGALYARSYGWWWWVIGAFVLAAGGMVLVWKGKKKSRRK
jgi:hypothetical protein